MKKVFNLSVILAVLIAAFSFTSCSDDDDDAAQITITFNQNGKFASGDDVTGKIVSAEEDLTKVVILLNGNAVKTITKFNSLPILKGDNGVYTMVIDGLVDGSYTLRAESKTGESSAAFTVGSAVNYTSFTAVVGGSEATTAGSFLSIQDGKVYKTADVNAGKGENVEIVFDGIEFKSATLSTNSNVSGNGQWAQIQLLGDNHWGYMTSTGFQGDITITSTTGSGNATVANITVNKGASAE